MGRRVIIAAGGTAGHLIPAHTLATRLIAEFDCEVLFAGGKLSENSFFDRRFPYRDLPCATFSPRRPLKAAITGWGTIKGAKLLNAFKPDLVVGFGSFHAFPLLMAARIKKIPTVLHEGNAFPGRVTRFFSRGCVTGLQFPSAGRYLRGPTVGVELGGKREASGGKLPLKERLPTALVFGGSLGAVRLNEVASQALCQLKEIQVIHLTGKETASIKAGYDRAGIPSYVTSFEKRMDLVWEAADFAICRAGAATCREQMVYQCPAIMVPYPFATDRHQDYNAHELEKRGGVIKLDEKALSVETLLAAVSRCLRGEIKVKPDGEQGEDFAHLIAKVAKW